MRHLPDGAPEGAPPAWSVGIIVPARDEERLIGRCLSALDAAVSRLRAERPHTVVRTVVVLDRCTDSTGRVVATFPEVAALEVDAGRVGVARSEAVEHLSTYLGDPRRAWVASTDADSAVPETWLVDQLAVADGGAELVTGFVTTDPSDTPAELQGLAPTPTHLQDGHLLVYGANLGFTMRAYAAAGGFPPLHAHEDVAFVEQARRRGVRCHASGSICVLTSGRVEGRAPEGFATYLRVLAHPDLAAESA